MAQVKTLQRLDAFQNRFAHFFASQAEQVGHDVLCQLPDSRCSRRANCFEFLCKAVPVPRFQGLEGFKIEGFHDSKVPKLNYINGSKLPAFQGSRAPDLEIQTQQLKNSKAQLSIFSCLGPGWKEATARWLRGCLNLRLRSRGRLLEKAPKSKRDKKARSHKKAELGAPWASPRGYLEESPPVPDCQNKEVGTARRNK